MVYSRPPLTNCRRIEKVSWPSTVFCRQAKRKGDDKIADIVGLDDWCWRMRMIPHYVGWRIELKEIPVMDLDDTDWDRCWSTGANWTGFSSVSSLFETDEESTSWLRKDCKLLYKQAISIDASRYFLRLLVCWPMIIQEFVWYMRIWGTTLKQCCILKKPSPSKSKSYLLIILSWLFSMTTLVQHAQVLANTLKHCPMATKLWLSRRKFFLIIIVR